jgi:hypothetical protein
MLSASKSGQYGGYQISRSVRLRSSASAYFNRTPASAATNGQKWTYSGWVKRGTLGSVASILSADAGGGTSGGLYFDTDNTLKFGTGATLHKTSAAVFRDPSAWYHIVVVADSTLATGANRLLLYINGVQQTWTSGTDPTLNGIWIIGKQSTLQGIGFAVGSAASTYFDGYLTEINFIDGQALTPSSFGVTNSYGVWSPIKYNGTYGNNGFYLNFSDNSGATATTIGKDSSGNGNNWTPNNINVSAYTGTPPNNTSYDSMLDVPTPWGDGGNGRGNYCTLNPLVVPTLSGGATVSNGNLRVAGSAGVSNAYARGTMALSGKFYAEFFFDVVNATASIGVDVVTATAGALNTSSTAVSYRSGGNRRVLGTESAYGASWAANDIIGVAVDTTANTIEFFKNGASQGVITSSAFFAQGDCIYAMSKDDVGSPIGYANFGQRPFSYTRPSGFNALNTFNLAEPSIDDGRLYMAATTYTGTGASRSVDNTVNNVSFQPDFVWVKGRSGATDHALYDSVRGVQLQLESNTTTAETTETTGLTAFNANGFAVGALAQMNTNTATYVGWQWRAGVSSVSNTSGSITSTVDAGTTQGFSIVTWTGNGSTGTVGHGLGVAPRFIITKYRNVVNSWSCYHASLGASSRIFLNTTDASGAGVTDWNSTSPTSSVFSVGNANTNASGGTYVAYCFAEITGFSRFSSYTGNGSADGPFVFCGFRPRWIMTKLSSAAGGGWWIYDTARDPYNATNDLLQANLSNASATSLPFDILSNGFKIRTSNVGANTNAATYIFAAFAENPFKYALAR